jgi:sirohydrochlorin cobaltochelatase
VPLVLERYQQCLGGVVAVNCDTCAYRAPWPGREGRVGQAIGVGHSHLAVEHRHSR